MQIKNTFFHFIILDIVYSNTDNSNYGSVNFWSLILFSIGIGYAFRVGKWTGCRYRKNFYRLFLPLLSLFISLILGYNGFDPANELPLIFTLIITFILHLGLKDSAERWIDNREGFFNNLENETHSKNSPPNS